MIPYIGDISKADAVVLAAYAQSSDSILEFGCGASTQVLAKYSENIIVSIDTEGVWIDKTKNNLDLFGLRDQVIFEDYYSFMRAPRLPFDFIFDDGEDSLRREFAIKMWPYLSVGGVLAFHDTRRGHDFRNVLEVLAIYHNEVDTVIFNKESSNITCIYKKIPEPYDNWQISENREPWMLGYDDLPEEFIKSIKHE